MDLIDLEILEDGTVSMKTGAVSDVNHLSADQLLAELDDLLGGTTTRTGRPDRERPAVHRDHAKAGH